MIEFRAILVVLALLRVANGNKGTDVGDQLEIRETTTSPFDDLTADEIRTTIRAVGAAYTADLRPSLRYPIIQAQEPPKAEWLSSGGTLAWRRAYAAVFDLSSNRLSEFIVDLQVTPARVVSQLQLPLGTLPLLLQTEFLQARAVVQADAGWQSAMKKRGLDPARGRLDILAPGSTDTECSGGRRLLRALTYYQAPGARFWYWVPVEGLIATVDLTTTGSGRVVTLLDEGEASRNLTTPPIVGLEKPTAHRPMWQIPNPCDRPPTSGPDPIRVRGQQVEWGKWKFQYSVDPVHGLQLRHVYFADECGVSRSVIYKITLGEIFVPYGPTGAAWGWRGSLDIGEYGLGQYANSLRPGVDVPLSARLFDCVLADEGGGEPRTVRGCVAIYERESRLLYKHIDVDTADTASRVARELVITFMTTAGNYDYALDYVLHADGTIQVHTRLTGIVQSRGVPGRDNDGSTPCLEDCIDFLGPYLVGPVHQHFFTFRIDFDVDGAKNHVLETGVTPDDDGLGGFSAKKRLLLNETGRDVDLAAHTTWHIVNAAPGSRNRYGAPRGYVLRPEGRAHPLLSSSSPFWAKAPFLKHPFWVTKYTDNETTPGARFPRCCCYGETPSPVGVAKYVQDNESIAEEDIVVWYTFGVTHVPRPEEWPLLDVQDVLGFTLIPFNFLSRNAAVSLKAAEEVACS